MYRSLLLLCLSSVLGAAPLLVDYVTVAGRDLKTLEAALAAVDLRADFGGKHANGVTEMASLSFPDGSYIEFIAAQPDADPEKLSAHYWGTFIQGNAGPCAWAVRAKNVSTEVKRLKAAGITVSDPHDSGRRRADGKELKWTTANVGSEPQGTFFPFLISDSTSRKDRSYPSGKPATSDFEGVSRVVIVVHDLAASVARFRQAYELGRPVQQVDADFGARLALFGGTPVILAEPLIPGSWISDRLAKFGEGPCAFILTGKKTKRYTTTHTALWFARPVSWFDIEKLHWRLGFED